MFHIKHYMLPHAGIIPGARSHKKQVIPAGTKVYCIEYGTLLFWCCYLNEAQAIKAMHGLESSATPRARRYIPLPILVQWNFKSRFPTRVARVP